MVYVGGEFEMKQNVASRGRTDYFLSLSAFVGRVRANIQCRERGWTHLAGYLVASCKIEHIASISSWAIECFTVLFVCYVNRRLLYHTIGTWFQLSNQSL